MSNDLVEADPLEVRHGSDSVHRRDSGSHGERSTRKVPPAQAIQITKFTQISRWPWPESWSEDRPRCREAGIPDDMVYRPKWQISLELYDRAIKNGLHFDWMTFDEGYGSKPDFLRGLDARGQRFVGEVPRSFTGWLKLPRVITRPDHKNRRGRGRKVPRLASGNRPSRLVEELLEEHAFADQAWQRWRVKDGEKGPMIWEVKHALFTPKGEDGLEGEPLHLVVARNVLDPKEVKFFVSNAPPDTPIAMLDALIYFPLTCFVVWFWCRAARWAYLHGRTTYPIFGVARRNSLGGKGRIFG
jgi:DDE superfamily endonuclease